MEKKVCKVCGVKYTRDKRVSRAQFNRSEFCSWHCRSSGLSKMKRTLDSRVIERFMQYVSVDKTGCWNWTGAKQRGGYGKFYFDGKYHGAHRFSLVIQGTSIGEGMYVCHKCDNPTCVNPDHLYVGAPVENMHDCKSRNRLPLGARRAGAKLSEEIVYAIRQSGMSAPEASRKYGVSASTIYHALRGRTWRHVC